MNKPTVIKIDEVEYVRKDSILNNSPAPLLAGMSYVICRTAAAGVFAGYLKSRNGDEVVLVQARRLWYWCGAASLSQAAMEGFKHPDKCKFPCVVNKVELLGVIEILECTENARVSIYKVPVWEA